MYGSELICQLVQKPSLRLGAENFTENGVGAESGVDGRVGELGSSEIGSATGGDRLSCSLESSSGTGLTVA